MMNILLVLLLALASAPARVALAADPAASRLPTPDELYIFIGNFGEVLTMPGGYVADAKMHGPIEVILFHPKYLEQSRAFGGLDAASRTPMETDDGHLQNQDFQRLDMVELVAIPKKPDPAAPAAKRGYESLKALCAAKKASLSEDAEALRIKYAAMDCPGKGCPDIGSKWPEDSCVFEITSPYHLTQYYVQSTRLFYILTSGIAYPTSDFATFTRPLLTSLMNNLEEYAPQDLWKPLRDLGSQRSLWVYWFLCNGVFLIVAGLPIHRWRRRLVLLGLSMATVSNGLLVYCVLSGIIETFMIGGRHINNFFLGLAAMCAMPAACWLAAYRFKARNIKTVLASVAVPAAAFGYLFILARKLDPEIALSGAIGISVVLFCMGVPIGLIFGSVIRPRELQPNEN
jgi:hypothetical protein